MDRRGQWLVEASRDFLDARACPLSDQAKVLLLILESFARENPFCFPGNKRLLEMANKCERAVQYGLEELERAGWILRVFVGGKKKKRTGFIMLRRSSPFAACATTPAQIEAAHRGLLDLINQKVTRVPKVAGSSLQKIASDPPSSGANSRWAPAC
jgi:hypothetical protein